MDRILKVAVYDQVKDLDAIDKRKKEFLRRITDTQSWEYVDFFVDTPATGAFTNNRREFKRMLGLAQMGQFDLIVTESFRFISSSLLECVKMASNLKRHELPIGVYFCETAVNTLTVTGDIVLTLLEAAAEDCIDTTFKGYASEAGE